MIPTPDPHANSGSSAGAGAPLTTLQHAALQQYFQSIMSSGVHKIPIWRTCAGCKLEFCIQVKDEKQLRMGLVHCPYCRERAFTAMQLALQQKAKQFSEALQATAKENREQIVYRLEWEGYG